MLVDRAPSYCTVILLVRLQGYHFIFVDGSARNLLNIEPYLRIIEFVKYSIPLLYNIAHHQSAIVKDTLLTETVS